MYDQAGGQPEMVEVSRSERSKGRTVLAALFAIAAYLVGCLIVALFAAVPEIAFGLLQHPVTRLLVLLVSSFLSMGFARGATDALMASYNRRAVAVMFMLIWFVVAVLGVTVIPWGPDHWVDEVGSLFMIFIVYQLFWVGAFADIGQYSGDAASDHGWRKLWQFAAPILGGLIVVPFGFLGLILLIAIHQEISAVTHLHGLISGLLATGAFIVPPLGLIMAFFGAKDVWGWPWWQAAIFALSPLLIFPAMAVVASVGHGVGSVAAWALRVMTPRRYRS